MKAKLTVALASLLISGCGNRYYHGTGNTGAWVRQESSQMVLVNNTPCALSISIEGVLVHTNVAPGQVVPVHPVTWMPRTAVVVTGYDSQGQYLGANDWIFYNGQAQVWRVERLHKPEH